MIIAGAALSLLTPIYVTLVSMTAHMARDGSVGGISAVLLMLLGVTAMAYGGPGLRVGEYGQDFVRFYGCSQEFLAHLPSIGAAMTASARGVASRLEHTQNDDVEQVEDREQ